MNIGYSILNGKMITHYHIKHRLAFLLQVTISLHTPLGSTADVCQQSLTIFVWPCVGDDMVLLFVGTFMFDLFVFVLERLILGREVLLRQSREFIHL